MAARLDLTVARRLPLDRWVAESEGPGVVVALASGGQVASWSAQGRGGTAAESSPLDPWTVFYVASLAKQFTATCVTLCEASGLLQIDTSIRSLVPELPPIFDPITPRLALHHLAGLPHGRDLSAAPVTNGDWRDGRGLWDLIEVLAREPSLQSPPGERYLYANAGYWLLAACVERASGETLARFAKRQLFDPLGMADTRFRDEPDQPQPGLVLGHRDGPYGPTPIQTRFHGVGDGGLLTTITDFAKWDLFWSGRSNLGDELPQRLLERGRRNDGRWLYYARGISLRPHRGLPTLSHSGSYIGYHSKWVRFPEQDLSIICLANKETIDVDAIAMALADRALAGTLDPAAPTWAASVRDDALAEA